jgi:hypothetical protein
LYVSDKVFATITLNCHGSPVRQSPQGRVQTGGQLRLDADVPGFVLARPDDKGGLLFAGRVAAVSCES